MEKFGIFNIQENNFATQSKYEISSNSAWNVDQQNVVIHKNIDCFVWEKPFDDNLTSMKLTTTLLLNFSNLRSSLMDQTVDSDFEIFCLRKFIFDHLSNYDFSYWHEKNKNCRIKTWSWKNVWEVILDACKNPIKEKKGTTYIRWKCSGSLLSGQR